VALQSLCGGPWTFFKMKQNISNKNTIISKIQKLSFCYVLYNYLSKIGGPQQRNVLLLWTTEEKKLGITVLAQRLRVS